MTEHPMPLEQIQAIPDPVERARVAEAQRVVAADLATAFAQIRADAAAELRAKGMSFGEIGKALGTTRERARQLATKGAVAEESG
jgi:hypothetical protein